MSVLRACLLAAALFAPSASKARADESPDSVYVDVRLTYYVEDGTTYGGGHTYYGSTACSTNFELGTEFELPDGEHLVCNDRGMLGSTGWLDVWRRPDLARMYGDYVTVRIVQQ